MRGGTGRGLAWAVVIAGWALLFGASLGGHLASSMDPGLFNDDARQQIWPFFRYHDGPARWRDDAIGRYYLEAFLPAGYRALMAGLARVVDPVVTSRVLPYALLAAVVGLLAGAARRLGGPAAAFGAGALALSAQVLLERMAGGLPRGFGFPVLALALWACVAGRPLALAASVVVAAACYPVASVAPGLALALWLFGLPARDRGRAAAWGLGRRRAVVGATALLAVLLVLPTVLAGRAHGRLIGPGDVAAFPEAGPGGRYGPEDRAPFPGLAEGILAAGSAALRGEGEAFLRWPSQLARRHPALDRAAVAGALGVAAAGLAVLAARGAAGRRVLALLVAAAGAFVVAGVAAPYLFLPWRHLLYPVGAVCLVLVPAGAAALGALDRGRAGRVLGPGLAVLVTAGVLLFVGGQVAPRAGLSIEARAGEPLHAVLAALPDDALVAGWPGGPIDDVPYVDRRPVLLSLETHQALHTAYALEMRARMDALIDATFAVDDAPLVALRERHGVTHLLVDRAHLTGTTPSAMRPFDEATRRAAAAGSVRPFFLLGPPSGAVVFEDARHVVVDLRRVGPAPR